MASAIPYGTVKQQGINQAGELLAAVVSLLQVAGEVDSVINIVF